MRKQIIGIMVAIAIATAAQAAGPAQQDSRCPDSDKLCKQMEGLAQARQFDKIVDLYDTGRQYSDRSRYLIGEACITLASQDNVAPALAEAYYQGALQVKHYSAYMGLYYLYAQKNEQKALGFLNEYIKTNPAESEPYAILGESELNRKNYELADIYLRQAKAIGNSPHIDWLLFQANYLLKNYQFAKEMFYSAVTRDSFDNELKIISEDPRFEGIGKRPEFKKIKHMLKIAQVR